MKFLSWSKNKSTKFGEHCSGPHEVLENLEKGNIKVSINNKPNFGKVVERIPADLTSSK